MKNVIVVNHPLVQHKLTYLRNKKTFYKDFKELLYEITILMSYEITRDLKLEETEVETFFARTKSNILAENHISIVAILRAGLGMVDGIISILPRAKIGHIGLFRDPRTLRPVEYYTKLPIDISLSDVIVADPMIATGYTADEAIKILKSRGVKNIKLFSIIAAPEGLSIIDKNHPDVKVFTASIDEKLNDHGYIIPGLGDAGDRLYGTK